jgi:predicted sugar kinase
MKKPEDINYNSKEILSKLEEMKVNDIEGFTNLILKCFQLEPDSVAQDPAPPAHKLKALNSMLEYLETTERYEDCAFIKKLVDQIEDEQ